MRKHQAGWVARPGMVKWVVDLSVKRGGRGYQQMSSSGAHPSVEGSHGKQGRERGARSFACNGAAAVRLLRLLPFLPPCLLQLLSKERLHLLVEQVVPQPVGSHDKDCVPTVSAAASQHIHAHAHTHTHTHTHTRTHTHTHTHTHARKGHQWRACVYAARDTPSPHSTVVCHTEALAGVSYEPVPSW
jgi:hypothetical protein